MLEIRNNSKPAGRKLSKTRGSDEVEEDKRLVEMLKEYFFNDPEWQNEQTQILLEKFFNSCLLKVKSENDQDYFDWNKLELFALYTCKQGCRAGKLRKALKIASESIVKD